MRGAWRLIPVAICIGLLVNISPGWRLLWLTDRASFLALGFVYVALLVITLSLVWSAVRWIRLAAWRGDLGIRVDEDAIDMRLGPFGTARYDWRDIRVEINGGFDPEMIEMMPDDAFVPCLRHPASDEDLSAGIQRFSRIPSESLTRLLRPYVRHKMSTGQSAQRVEEVAN